jgi:hypothetical protein
MGLDMFLHKNIYVGANYEHRNVTGTVDIKVDGQALPIPFNRISEISLLACYWRKANAIHKWFVDNCQDGVDECQNTYVPVEKLKELLSLCERVKENHSLAGELLPTESGFFFGSTDYGTWYWEDIDYTIQALSEVLLVDNMGGEYYYHSSW